MQAHAFMTRPVVTVPPGAEINTAARLLLGRDVTAMPVVDERGRLVGIVSRSDLVRGRVLEDPRAHLRPVTPDGSPAPRTVADEMTRDVVTLPPEADEAEFARVMLGRRVNSIPVVDGDEVVGMVSVTDLRIRTRSDAQIALDVRSRLHELAPGRFGVSVDGGVVTITGETSASRGALELAAATVPGVVRVRHEPGESDSEDDETDGGPSAGARTDGPPTTAAWWSWGRYERLDRLRLRPWAGWPSCTRAARWWCPSQSRGRRGPSVVFRTT